MSEDQFWLCIQPPFQIAISSYYSGLFGVYGLQIWKYWNLCFINSKWSQIYQKIRKNCIFDSLAFDLAFATFVVLFSIFLKSLMPDKTSGVQNYLCYHYFIKKRKWMRFGISDQCVASSFKVHQDARFGLTEPSHTHTCMNKKMNLTKYTCT